MDEELARLRNTDLIAVAISWGYAVEPRKSCTTSTVLRCGKEKIVVSKKPDGQVYCSTSDQSDSGGVIDFVRHRLADAGQPSNLGHVRKWLREFSGQVQPTPKRAVGKRFDESAAPAKPLADRWRALAAPMLPHPYLIHRGLPESIQSDERWADRIRIDEHGNLCFCHYDQGRELCGWEVKNHGWTGFASGGKKGIWAAGIRPSAEVVITESAIDCLSHAALYPDDSRGYISVAGQVSTAQLSLLREAIRDRHAIIATDADAAGDLLAARIAAVVPRSERMRPPAHKDWNDLLRAEQEDRGVRL